MASPRALPTAQDKDGKDQFISNALPDKKSMDEVVAALEDAEVVGRVSVQARQQQRRPLAPFITSQLQRDAAGKLGFNVRRTMGVAQRCTKAWRSAPKAQSASSPTCVPIRRAWRPKPSPAAREWIGKNARHEVSARRLPRCISGKKDAQDAHEAIRPTDASRTPESIARVSDRRAAQALSPHLAAFCRIADDAGACST